MNAHTAELQLPWGISQIEKAIPHRYPFLLVDRVMEITPKKNIFAIKNISVSDPVLQGHFPGFPVFPGVMMVEGLAQAAGILSYVSLEKPITQMLLTEVQNARFRRLVQPGDVLTYKVEVTKSRGKFFWFSGIASVGDEVAVECDLSAQLS